MIIQKTHFNPFYDMRFIAILICLFLSCHVLVAQDTPKTLCKAILTERNKLQKGVDSLLYTYSFSNLIRQANIPYRKAYLPYNGGNLLVVSLLRTCH